MTKKYEQRNKYKPRKEDTYQASVIIVVASIAGLAATAILAPPQGVSATLCLYAIFGGGILGTDNIIKLIKLVLRIK